VGNKRIWAGTGALALLSLALASGGAAADGEARAPGLVALDATSVTLSEDEPLQKLRLCNTTDIDVPVYAKVDVDTDDTPKPTVTVPASLDAGRCGRMSVAQTREVLAAVASNGGGAGTVTLVSGGAGSLSVTFTLAGGQPTAAVVKALGETKFHATTRRDSVELEEADVSVLYDADNNFTKVPDHNWVLVDGSHKLKVKGNFKKTADEVRVYHLRADQNHAEPGTYEGVIKLGGDKGDVPVTVEVDDPLWWFVGLILLGVAGGAVLKVVTDHTRITSRLETVRRGLSGQYSGSLGDWDERFLAPDPGKIKTFLDENRAAQKVYTKTVPSIDVENPAFVKVVEGLQGAVEDAEIFRTKLKKSLTDLDTARDELTTWLNERLPAPPRVPVLLGPAKGAAQLLRDQVPADRALRVGEAKELVTAADDMAKVLTKWRAAAERVVRLAQWVMTTERQVGPVDGEAKVRLSEALRALWLATDTASIAEMNAGAVLDEAFDLIASAAGGRTVPPYESAPTPSWAGLPQERARALQSLDVFDSVSAGPASFEVAWDYISAVGRRLADHLPLAVAVVLAFVTAYATGKATLYDGQDFATPTTVVATVLLGLAATPVIDALFKALAWSMGGLKVFPTK
jgi:hypothetical protein